MSNKVLKDANNQLVNIDSSNLSSFSEDVVHKGSSSSLSNEDIYGTKTFKSGGISFSNTIGSDTYNSWITEGINSLTFRTRKGGYDLTQGNLYVTIPTLSDPTAQNVTINFPATSGTLATTDDLDGKVSKTGDTMIGDLQLNVGSGYSLSPKLVFVNHGGNGYLYKDNDNLILNHVGSSSNYTLTFPAKTANIATTTKTVIVRNSGYSPQFTYASLDVEYYDEDNNANTIRLAEGESTTINCVAWCLKRVDTIATAEPVLGLYSGIAFAGANSSIYRQIQSGGMYITVPITDWDGIVLPVTETSAFECYHAVARRKAA